MDHAARKSPALPLVDAEIHADVAAVIHSMGLRFTDINGPQPIELFDPDEPAPQYLGEELDDWMIGWDALRWYFETPERFAMIEAMDYHPSNIRVRSLTDDLALATWNVHAEMKFRRGAPLGEKLRANAILRRTAAGWRFIYYAEAPKSALAYMRDLYANMASPEFRARFDPPAKLTDPPTGSDRTGQ
ncbi:MAG: nuclear transport factor 2 family protein [Gammaproteobacteria bacterium]|nr:nuclear transport factor 2 family protein [Gammaproteobacteria bacterium]